MLTTRHYEDKLLGMAEQFNEAYWKKEYARANWILLQAEIIARFLELPQETMSELFGQWPDDGDANTIPPKGLFDREKAHEVGWHSKGKTIQTRAKISRDPIPVSFYPAFGKRTG